MWPSHNEQCPAMFGQHLVLYDLRKPLVTMSQIRRNVFPALDLVPINVGVSAKNAHLMLAVPFHICFANGLIYPARYGRRGSDSPDGIAPRLFHLLSRNILARSVAID